MNRDDPTRTAARRRALDHVLAGIAGSVWSADLMLRGSTLLRAWFGDMAREPGDLDFVVIPHTVNLDDGYADDLLDGVLEAAARASRADTSATPVRIDAAKAEWDDIWDYDAAPGRRYELPYDAGDAGHGRLQIDFTFNERVPTGPVATEIPRADGGAPATVLAASPELSLAWKLLWLVNEAAPQGKDLFDAVLLAEHVYLSADLLVEVSVLADATPRPVTEATLRAALHRADASWKAFRNRELPDGPVTPAPFAARLLAALHGTFDAPRETR
ncbi:nucleotidyl transferase AbiEii/AbiGii toxin family protein [Actinomadura oligospora]|uniref:nucleotidyl transferase AbiEii/AbiGii toxin family protein n=1 Tax=Actinomadura oligospora TaxID=111804 RepID=UPI0004AE461B|nr:nucleotidyl transferase AbiEii/AbiGii toxin family protein [Actinomadura oligospora]